MRSIDLTLARSSEFAVALLEHVRALVQLLVALQQPALEPGELGASRPGFLFGLALHAQLLVLGLEDEESFCWSPRALDDEAQPSPRPA